MSNIEIDIKEGDTVIIIPPEDWTEWPSFDGEMLDYCFQPVKVLSITCGRLGHKDNFTVDWKSVSNLPRNAYHDYVFIRKWCITTKHPVYNTINKLGAAFIYTRKNKNHKTAQIFVNLIEKILARKIRL